MSELSDASSTSPAAVDSLTSILRGTLQHLVQIKPSSSGAASEAEATTIVPLVLALDHPSSAVRLAGIREIQKGLALVKSADPQGAADVDDDDDSEETRAVPDVATVEALGPILLRRVQDDSVEVLSAALVGPIHSEPSPAFFSPLLFSSLFFSHGITFGVVMMGGGGRKKCRIPSSCSSGLEATIYWQQSDRKSRVFED